MFLIYAAISIFTLIRTTAEACPENQSCDIQIDDANIKALIQGMEKFSYNFMMSIYTDADTYGNIFCSPISVYSVLALMLFGSKGSTFDTLAAALGFPLDNIDENLEQLQTSLGYILDGLEVLRTATDNDSKKYVSEEVVFGQGIFLQNGYRLTDIYRELLAKIDANDFCVDFTNQDAATKTINDWIADHTGKRVSVGVFEPFPSDTQVLLASTVYFSARWEHNLFQKENIGSGIFYTASGLKREITTMSTTKTLAYYDNGVSFSAVQLPYQGGEYVMVLVLPYADWNVDNFVQKFSLDEYGTIISDSQQVLVQVTMPKFIAAFSSTLRKYLTKLNLGDMFNSADLSNMIENLEGDLRVAEVLHSTAMKIDENGTIASSITVAEFLTASLMSVEGEDFPISFIVDRSFLIYVHSLKTNIPIFTALIREL